MTNSISDRIRRRARRSALKVLARELEKYQEKVDKTDNATYVNLFNTGLHVNMKTIGKTGLKLARKLLEHAYKHDKKPRK